MTSRTHKKLCHIVDHVWDKWNDALQRWTIYRSLATSPELAKALTPSYSAHVHNTIVNMFMVDMLREIGAIILDTDKSSASLYRATKLIKSAGVAEAIRQQYEIVIPVRQLNDGLDPAMKAEVSRHWDNLTKERNRKEFAELGRQLNEVTADLFDSPVAKAIWKTRNKAVAHYDVQEVGTEWRTVGIGDAGLTMGAMEDYIAKCTEAVRVATLFVQSKSMDFDDARSIHEKYAGEYIDALVRGRQSQEAEREVRKRQV